MGFSGLVFSFGYKLQVLCKTLNPLNPVSVAKALKKTGSKHQDESRYDLSKTPGPEIQALFLHRGLNNYLYLLRGS